MRLLSTPSALTASLILFTAVSLSRGQSAPPNDMFDSRITLVGPETNVVASNVGATSEPGEPNHATRQAGRSVWWTWTAPADTSVAIDTLGSSFDTVLAVYTGESLSTLKFVAGTDDISGSVLQSRVVFQASAGTNYQVAVDGFGAQVGILNLRLREGPLPPEVVTGPQSTTGALSTAVSLGVTLIGDAPLSFQWFKDTALIPDATNSTFTIPSMAQTDVGAYTVAITNVAGAITSTPAVLSVSPVVLVKQPANSTASAGYATSLSVSAIGAAPLLYQWFKDTVPLAGATLSKYSITLTQPSDAGAYSVTVSNANGSATSTGAVLTVQAPYTFTTFAGAARVTGTNDGPGSLARFYYPHGIAISEDGSIYVSELGNESVRKITPEGMVSTVVRLRPPQGPGANPYLGPWGVAVDKVGNIYISDTPSNTIMKALPDGTLSAIAGTAGPGGLVDGTNGAARFSTPSALVIDTFGNLLVADWDNGRLRRITPEGVVTTVATKAGMPMPSGVGVDDQGNVVVSSEGLSYLAKVLPNGAVASLADGLNAPHGAVVDSLGNVYTADTGSYRILKVTPDGSKLVIGGAALKLGLADGVGPQARFSAARGIVVDKNGSVYVADYDNHTIRKGVPFAVTNLLKDQTVVAGSVVTLRVDPWGPTPLYFQWYFGGAPLTGQTNNSLTIGPLTAGDTGVYSVEVRDGAGNTLRFNSTVSVFSPSRIESVQTTETGTVRLLFRHLDGSLPADLTKVAVEWREDLTTTAPGWQTASGSLSTNAGYVLFEDTNSLSAARFYRIRE